METEETGTKRKTRSEKPIERKILRAKRLGLNSSCENSATNFKEHEEKNAVLVKPAANPVNNDSSLLERNKPKRNSGKGKRKLRSAAKVDVAQDDDNLSTETSSGDELKKKKKAAKKNKKKKGVKKDRTHVQAGQNLEQVEEKSSEDTEEERKLIKKRKSARIQNTDEVFQNKVKKLKTSTSMEDFQVDNSLQVRWKEESIGKRQLRKKKIADKGTDNVEQKEENKENEKEQTQKIGIRRSTFEVEEPSFLRLNSPAGSGWLDNETFLNISGIGQMSDFPEEAQILVSEADSTTSNGSPLKGSSTQENRNSFALKEKVRKVPNFTPSKSNKKKSPSKMKKIKTPPSSTPSTAKKSASLLKRTLKKNVSFISGPSTSRDVNASVSSQIDSSRTPSRSRMPNFAMLHKREEEKLENIEEHKNRQAERAKALLSGNKPSTSMKKVLERSRSADDAVNRTKTKKQLNYSFNSSVSTSSRKCESLVKIPNTVVQKVATEKRENRSIPVQPVKPIVKNPVQLAGYNRFGFMLKGDERKAVKEAVANKTKTSKNIGVQEKREILKGVRSNRRFDLLMQMRQKME